MNKQEIGIVVGVTTLIIVTFLAVAFLSSGSSPIKEKSTQKRFSASPGKTREKPLLLVSKKREDTFGNTDDEKKEEGETAHINKIYSSQLGTDEGESRPNITEGSFDREETKNKKIETEITENLKQLLESEVNNQQIPEEAIEEKLDKWMDSVQSQEKKLEILKSHFESLISKGLTEWVEERLKEITEQEQDKTVLSETQWLLAELKSIQGDVATAEQYYQQAWQNISSAKDLNDPKQEEILRLLGLNYVQFLRKQNKKTEAEAITSTVTEKLRGKNIIKD